MAGKRSAESLKAEKLCRTVLAKGGKINVYEIAMKSGMSESGLRKSAWFLNLAKPKAAP